MGRQWVWYSEAGEVGIVVVSNPPVNALNHGVVEGIARALEPARQSSSVKAVILTTLGRTFIAGADINEFRKAVSCRKKHESLLHPLLQALEDFQKPIICAIHGSALGGGFEIAMACHYRVAALSAMLGQPEVKLGLIPGGGGTQRLPRLAGVAMAAEMCSQGNSIGAADALESGILDRVFEEEILAGAQAFAQEVIAQRKPPRRTRDLDEKLADRPANAAALEEARAQARKQNRGQMAPLRAIDAIEAATVLSFNEGCRRESEIFNECLFSEESKALIHVFFAEREVSRIPGIGKDTRAMKIEKAAVVGAGNMGSGIAMTFANAGIPVVLKEVSQDLLDRGVAGIRKNYESSRKGSMTPEQIDRCLKLIRPTLSYGGFSDVDLVVEAVYENMQLKKQVFSELDGVCKPEAILATNTSTLDVDQIASATSRPRRVIGLHFFAPAQVMKLVEIVRGKTTASDVVASSFSLAKMLKKTGLVVRNCRGFAGNRMYHQYQREAQFLVEEGSQVQEVDTALYNFGMAMGPFAVRDLSGLDVAWRIQKEYKDAETRDARHPLVLDRLCEMGRFGQKAGAGWYRYHPGDRTPHPDPEVELIVEECARQAGIKRRMISPEEIIERTIYALVNEGAKILQEGIVQRTVALDVIFIAGYGFPAYRGGPMWYADRVGLKTIYNRIIELEQLHGSLWTPAPLLKQLAEAGKSFAQMD